MKGRLQFGDRLSIRRVCGRDAVRHEGFNTAETHPLIEKTGVAKASDGDLFMIALQKHRLASLAVLDQSIDRFTRRGSPIDIAAQKNVKRLVGRRRREDGNG